jgi:hypothetical protein
MCNCRLVYLFYLHTHTYPSLSHSRSAHTRWIDALSAALTPTYNRMQQHTYTCTVGVTILFISLCFDVSHRYSL